MDLRISAEHLAAAEALLGGRSVNDLRVVDARANFTVGGDEDRARLASLREAGQLPMVTDGFPTILRSTAWLAHEGENKKGLIFLKEELPAAAARIREPNFLIMDFNHSAVRVSDHPKAIGLWHKATVAFDKHARGLDGTRSGAWGILLEGISWAWAFPEYAAELIAEQDRHGAVRFSMTCLPTASEFITGADGRQREIAHDPRFFTLSALNVPNADPDAWGFMTDNDDETQTLATETLLAADALTSGTITTATTAGTTTYYNLYLPPNITGSVAGGTYVPSTTVPATAGYFQIINPPHKEHSNMPENTPVDVSALTLKVAELAAENETLKNDLATTKAAQELASAARDTASTEAETVKTKLAETETSRDALVAELAASKTLIEQYTAQIAEFMAERSARELEQTNAAKSAKLAERIAALPESYRDAHAKKSDEAKARVETKWADMSDEAWESYRTDELLVGLAVASEGPAGMYLRKSRAEGALPVGGGDQNSRKSRIRALLDK